MATERWVAKSAHQVSCHIQYQIIAYLRRMMILFVGLVIAIQIEIVTR